LIVAKNDIADLKSLEGRTMAISGVGAAVHTFATLMMQKRGVDVSKVVWSHPEAVRPDAGARGGRTDAAILSSTFTAQALNATGRFHVIADSANDLPNYPWCCEIVRRTSQQIRSIDSRSDQCAVPCGTLDVSKSADATRMSQKLSRHASGCPGSDRPSPD